MNSVQPITPAGKWSAYWRLMRFDRPIGILLLLWPTLWALWMAGAGSPTLKNLVIFTFGVVVMRAAGCVMNDIADRDFDPHVERTRSRPLAAGEIGLREAYGLLAVLMSIALGLVLMTNRLTVLLAVAGAALALSYPFFKRITHLPQFVLGVAFAWGIPMAFAAETGTLPAVLWWLVMINVLYAVIYDTLYAMVDRVDDIAIGVKSTAILFAARDLAWLRALKLGMLVLLLWLGLDQHFQWPWYAAVAIVAALFTWQQLRVRGRQRDACFAAFRNNNWVGLAIFAGLVGHYLLT